MTRTELSEALIFIVDTLYVQLDGMVYQQTMGIPIGTNCAPLITDLFIYCYDCDFMSNIQQSKRFNLIDKSNDTTRYRDDKSAIDNLEFAEHFLIYLREIQLNKANTSAKETSFFDLNIKVNGSNIHTTLYDKRDDFGPLMLILLSTGKKLLASRFNLPRGTSMMHCPQTTKNWKIIVAWCILLNLRSRTL